MCNTKVFVYFVLLVALSAIVGAADLGCFSAGSARVGGPDGCAMGYLSDIQFVWSLLPETGINEDRHQQFCVDDDDIYSGSSASCEDSVPDNYHCCAISADLSLAPPPHGLFGFGFDVCSSDSDCESYIGKEYCQENFCREVSCVADASCPSGVCYDGQCTHHVAYEFFRTGCPTDWVPCSNHPCYSHDDCKGLSGKEYCQEDFCHEVSCVADAGCPSGSVCYDGQCTHVDDKDGDGHRGTLRFSDGPVPQSYIDRMPDVYDCNDYSPLCTDNCGVNKDACVSSCYGYQDDNIDDCEDFCIDVDGDGACDKDKSVKFIPTEFYSSLDAAQKAVFDAAGFVHDDERYPRWQDLGRVYWREFGPVALAMGMLPPDEAKKRYMDCNDNDPLVTPFVPEDDSCNLFDDDCDGEIDECRVVGGRPLSCIYMSTDELEPACVLWDFDGDGFKNMILGCIDCIDCNDLLRSVNPSMDDCPVAGDSTCDGVDNNCNGVADEMTDSDSDGIIDSYWRGTIVTVDRCAGQGFGKLIDYNGCHYAVGRNMPGWSLETGIEVT